MPPRRIVSDSEDDDSSADVPLGTTVNANGNSAAGPPKTNGTVASTPLANGKRKLSVSAQDMHTPKKSKKGGDSPATAKKEYKAKPAQIDHASSDLSSDDDVPLAGPAPGPGAARQVVALAIPPKSSSSNGKTNGIIVSEDVPLAAATVSTNGGLNGVKPVTGGGGVSRSSSGSNGTVHPKEEEDSSDDDVPLQQQKKIPPVPKKRKAKASDEDDDAFTATPKPKKAPAKRTKKVKKEESDADLSDDDDDNFGASTSTKKTKAAPRKSKKAETAKVKAEPKNAKGKAKAEPKDEPSASQLSEPKSPSKKRGKKEEEEEEEEQYKWWEADALGDGSQKWTTLEHSGVYFPLAYEPLPKNVKLLYNGKPVDLPPESEEVAGFFGAMLETDHAKDDTFCKNFFKDFLDVLKKHPPTDGTKIKDFATCDFTKMYEYFEAERAKKKSMSAAEKKDAKAKKEEIEAKYMYCQLDGRKEKVGNFRAEPPGLFRGRGEHPKKGSLKLRLRPEDITLNIGANSTVPEPNVPGKWGKVIHDNTVTWLAHWKENINGNAKYVFLAAGSSLKGQSDMQKFEKARELKKHVEAIRADYKAKLTSRVTAERQLATALYFIDKLALRAGNEKGEDEADTVGCCSLRYEHVTLKPPDEIVFDFLGKDSIRYYNVVKVDAQVSKNIRIFKGDGKVEGDAIFDRVTTGGINKYLTNHMKGLTAKVFRTYNASITFQHQLLERTKEGGTMIDKLSAYNEANRMVAILCNHQKSVSKNHGAAMEKMENGIKALKYQRRKLRYALFDMNKKFKKDPQYADEESDIDDEWIASYEDESRAKEIEKVQKKHEKDNEKRKADGEDEMGEDVLEDKIQKINEEYDRLQGERDKKTAEIKGKKTEDQIVGMIEKVEMKIKDSRFKMDDKEKGKEVSLGTSKINYLDPRITTAWCRRHNVPIEKMFNKALIVKFPWAMEVDAEWKF